MTNKKQVLIRITPELHAEIKKLADSKDVSMNEWMARALSYAVTLKSMKYTVTTIQKVEL